MTTVAFVVIDDVVQSTGTLAGFAGDEVRGVTGPVEMANPIVGPYQGEYPFFLTIYANADGETIQFQFEKEDGTRLSLSSSSDVVFADGDVSYQIANPLVLSSG